MKGDAHTHRPRHSRHGQMVPQVISRFKN
jgi:hypothetical protein